ncbi:MAG: alpha-2-macroglobulin family protein [Pseudomonadota bacterium]
MTTRSTSAGDAGMPTVEAYGGTFAEGWKAYDTLTDEQKYEEASTLVEKLLAKARQTQDGPQQVRSLIRWVQLRSALHGYETSVRFLREQQWPEELLSHTTLSLYYASLLEQYAQVYSWEIRQREKVESTAAVDLKAWTHEQIHSEAQRALQELWPLREQLGSSAVEKLSEYVARNNYPQHIRPTLRDTLSYLRADQFADSGRWRPEHQNEIYQLSLPLLIGGGAADAEGSLPDDKGLLDAAVHPLLKLAAVLDDLERWHQGRQEPEAAFEARRTRLELLHRHFSGDADRARLRDALRAALKGVDGKPWWALGMATLAEMVREEPAPDALVRARGIALQAVEAFPDSVGGQRGRHIAAVIELPDYNLEAMRQDGVERRAVGVTYKNLTTLYFRAHRLDLKAHLESQQDYNLYLDQRQLEVLVDKKPLKKWSEKLEATTDFRMHRSFVTPPLGEPGFYIIIASAREDFSGGSNKLQAVPVILGDLELVSQQQAGDKLEVMAVSGSSGRPRAGVEVFLYQYDWRKRHHSVARERTGANGLVRFVRKPGDSFFVLARSGGEAALDPGSYHFYQSGKPGEVTASLLYTDRSIYRPLQKLKFKVLVYSGQQDEGQFKVATKRKVSINLMDPNHQVVATQELTTNDFGTASGEFDIPTGRLLGNWQLRSSLSGYAAIKVEEYKRPTFEATLKEPAEALRLNREAEVRGEARYYFGLPVTSGQVRWRVQRTPQYPWWWSWWGGNRSAPQTVAAGTSSLDDSGAFTLRFTPRADERDGTDQAGVTYRYGVSVEVIDEGGETRTASRSFRLGFVAVEARVEQEHAFERTGQAVNLRVVRTDLDGAPQAGPGSWRLLALRQPDKTLSPADLPLPEPRASGDVKPLRTTGDGQRPRWATGYTAQAELRRWSDGAEISRGELSHDAKGISGLELGMLKPGAYRLRYQTQDAFGARYQLAHEFVVSGGSHDLHLPELLLVESSSVQVGGTARILALSGLDKQRVIVDIFRRGSRSERREMVAGSDGALIEIPITEKDRGGFGVTLWLVHDHQLIQESASIFVPWDSKQLDLELTTFRDKLEPGQKETWTVKVTGPAGQDSAVAAAEVLAYMYDRSLDSFAPHNPPSPLALYPSHTGVVGLRTSLGQVGATWVRSYSFGSPPGYPSLYGDRLNFPSGYGIGGPGARGGHGGRYREGLMPPSPSTAAPARKLMAKSESLAGDERLAEAPAEELSRSDDGAKDKDGRDAPPPPPPPPADEAAPVRSNFSETAFFEPHLVTGDDGTASIRFEVPDSVTSWNVWVHAVTKDLMSGSLKKEARTVKELMVRPYLPRFLREGDQAVLKVVVNNASDEELRGELDLDIFDPASNESLLKEFGLDAKQARGLVFAVKPQGGSNLSFTLKTPARVGSIAVKVVARAGKRVDGEQRALPILPSRMHLMQSRFVVLKDKARREMVFEDLKQNDDPSRIDEQLVVTLDGQLFYAVLDSLPYLVNYPYECTEQTLNRFVSTGILTSLYGQYPAVATMAKKMSERSTQLEQWDAPDPNRKMALEETPWLQQAQGGRDPGFELLRVLDPTIATAQRDGALSKLKKSQTSSGGFPWFPGGPPSPYITLYLVYGLSKAVEFGVDVPQQVVQRAFGYLKAHYLSDDVKTCMAHDGCWEFVSFLNYTIGNFPDTAWTGGAFSDADRRTMLDFSFKHWKQHAPYLKGYLALTLKRMDRAGDARLVWQSVMDSAKSSEDQGTYWAPEDRSWLWYNDTIETHAFALRTLMELEPQNPKLDGLVVWLFLNKKLNHWKSTRATAEVLYSLAHYLKATGALGVREEAHVQVGDVEKTFVFEPDQYTGKKNQIVIAGPDVKPKTSSTVKVEKDTKGVMFASSTWHFSTEKLPDEARGDFLGVTRKYFLREKSGREVVLKPLAEKQKLQPGDEVEVQISLTSKHALEYVHLRDPRGAGFEPVDNTSRHKWNLGLYWYEEIRDSGTNFFFERLPVGEYTFKYRIRAAMAGTFRVGPATVQPMYAPEFAAYSAGHTLQIAPATP